MQNNERINTVTMVLCDIPKNLQLQITPKLIIQTIIIENKLLIFKLLNS